MRWAVLIVAACASGARADHSKEPDAILRRNIFCSGCTVAPAGGARASPLAIELISTMVCPRDALWSMAVLRERTARGEARLYRSGEQLAGATVIRVVNRRVYLTRDGRIEYLELAAPARAAGAPPDDLRCAGTRCTIARDLVEQLLRDPTRLVADVRVFPALRDREPIGFQLGFVRPGSVFARLGLERGDTLRAVNGLPLATAGQVMDAWPQLRHASRLTVQIERAGRPLEMDFSIVSAVSP